MKALLLFDVDGTLLLSGGAGSRCVKQAAEQVFGQRLRWEQPTAGTMDGQFILDLAQECGIEDAAQRLEAYKRVYLEALRYELERVKKDVQLLPGVRELLSEISRRRDVVMGLLTGNFRRAAELKFAAAGLEESLFAVSVFAEDGLERRELVPAALRQFEQHTGGRGEPERTIIIGDTPRDIACARATGCRVLAVATGWYSLEDLRAEGPDRVVENLTQPQPLYELIEEALRHRSDT